jgi:hypothetical protein
MKWAIWKARVDDDSVRFVHIDDLPNSGFASVYNFSEADARSMEALGTYKSFKGTVYCSTLKIDCDNEEIANSVEGRLQAKEVGYAKYSTGGRGAHFHVERLVEPSHLLPYIDKAYVSREFPGADVSFYHHVGWYRQNGATHKKTGLRKTLVNTVTGSVLDMRGETLNAATQPEQTISKQGIQSVFSDARMQRLTVPYSGGERHNRYCAVAARLCDLGQPEEWAFMYLFNVNLMSDEPLGEPELRRILDWAFNQRERRD